MEGERTVIRYAHGVKNSRIDIVDQCSIALSDCGA